MDFTWTRYDSTDADGSPHRNEVAVGPDSRMLARIACPAGVSFGYRLVFWTKEAIEAVPDHDTLYFTDLESAKAFAEGFLVKLKSKGGDVN